MNPFGPPAVRSIVIVVVVVERSAGKEPAAVVKIVVRKVAAVEFAVRRTAGKPAAAHMAHAMAAEAAATVAAAQSTAAEAAATAPTATPAVSKSVAGDGRACQRQSGNQGDNLMQTKILHCRSPFHVLDRPAPCMTAANACVRQVLPAI